MKDSDSILDDTCLYYNTRIRHTLTTRCTLYKNKHTSVMRSEMAMISDNTLPYGSSSPLRLSEIGLTSRRLTRRLSPNLMQSLLIWCRATPLFVFFFFNDAPTPDIYSLPLHAPLPT